MTDTPLAQRLRCVMGVRRLTMREIGKACGVTPQAVHKWTRGSTSPSASALAVICELGGCSMEWLLYPHFLDLESTGQAPQGRHAKYWVREAIAELREEERAAMNDETVAVPRERLAKKLENTPLYEGHGEESDLPDIAAEQLRADGERIKALEAVGRALLAADERGQGQPWADAMERLRQLVAHP